MTPKRWNKIHDSYFAEARPVFHYLLSLPFTRQTPVCGLSKKKKRYSKHFYCSSEKKRKSISNKPTSDPP